MNGTTFEDAGDSVSGITETEHNNNTVNRTAHCFDALAKAYRDNGVYVIRNDSVELNLRTSMNRSIVYLFALVNYP